MTSKSDADLKFYKQKQFERLFASRYDFSQANFCARFLLKKGWHAKPWERRGSIYKQQTAFVTNLVVSYSRPFTGSKGWPAFPLNLIIFSENQKAMHKRILQMRNEIFAHSDSRHFKFEPSSSEGFRTTIEHIPFSLISKTEAEDLKLLTSTLINTVDKRLNELHLELI